MACPQKLVALILFRLSECVILYYPGKIGMSFRLSPEQIDRIACWIEHVQSKFLSSPSSETQLPAGPLFRHFQRETLKAKENRYSGLVKLEADIQNLLDMRLIMQREQYVRSIMEAADLTTNEHPFCVELRDFARSQRRP